VDGLPGAVKEWPSRRERRRRGVLLADPDVARWVRRLEKGAPSTKDVWPRRLGAFCVQTKTTPKALLELQPRALVDLLDQFEAQERKRGARGSYVAFTVKVVRSWLRYGGRDIPRGAVKVKDADKVYEETALSRDQLRTVYNAATAREKVAVALMATAGLRPMVLGNYSGDDGLRLGDLPDVAVRGDELRVLKVPLRVVVRQDLSKAGHTYFSFLGTESADYLRTYLETRLRSGEKLGPDSAVIVPERAKVPYIRTTNIGDLVRHALRAAELKNRPYVLRTTFAQRLLTAESAGKIPHAFAQFWMGHTGDMTARYSVNRGLLPETTVDEMRAAYKRCEPYLSTVPYNDDQAERTVSAIRAVLRLAGYPDAQVAAMDLETIRADQLSELIDKRPGAARGAAEPSRRQKVIEDAELPRFLADGWVARMPVNGSKFVVERSA
jgi:integrase